MLTNIQVGLDVDSFATLVDALRGGGDKAVVLSQMRREVERLRSSAKEYSDSLDAFYEQATCGRLEHDLLARAADLARQIDAAAREKLHSRIDDVRRKRNSLHDWDHAEARQLADEAIAIAETCLNHAADLNNRVELLLAAAAGSLQARPLCEAPDYAELSREHIARYPNIRARLAE